MLPPHELKTKKFAKVFHGYSPEEVDDQIAFLLEQYTELYRENDDLERKLRMALSQLDAYKTDEESIRSALIGAQKAGGKIVRDANERAELLLKAAKETCDSMVNRTAVAIREQMEILTALRRQATTFRATLLAQYAEQVKAVENGAVSERDTELTEFADEELVRSIIAGIKEEAANLSRAAETPLPQGRRTRSGTIWNKETNLNAPPAPAETAEPAPKQEQPEAAPAAEEIAAQTVPAEPAVTDEDAGQLPAPIPAPIPAPTPEQIPEQNAEEQEQAPREDAEH